MNQPGRRAPTTLRRPGIPAHPLEIDMRATQIDRLVKAIEAYELAEQRGSDNEKSRCLAVLDSAKRCSSRREIGAAYREYVAKAS
jgi:hypothetical protein